jgi:hypothetical protein
LTGDEEIYLVKSQQQTQSDIEHASFLPVTLAGTNLIYKYADSNLFAVLVKAGKSDGGFDGTEKVETDHYISVYIINGISGKIVYKFKEKDIDVQKPIDMVIAENYCITSFVRRTKTGSVQGQELSVVELYQSRIEQDTLKMLKDYYISKADRLTQTKYSSYSLDTPVVSHMSYLLTIDVKKLALTTSTSHISTK